MPNTCGRVQWRRRRRPTAVVAVLLALAVLTTRVTAAAAQAVTATSQPQTTSATTAATTTTTTATTSTMTTTTTPSFQQQQTPTKPGDGPATDPSSSVVTTATASSSLSQNNINYFAVNEANSPLAVLDLLEATMQIYHKYPHHNSDDTVRNDSSSFTTGVVLVALSEDEFSIPDVFLPNRLRPVYSMQGTSRQLKVPEIVYKRAVQLLQDADEITVSAILRQERANTGSIVSFSLDSNRYLELESSGRKDEVRLHYVSRGSHHVHTEVFAYALADDRWHAVAITLSGTQARLFVDCRLVYTRTLAAGPADTSFTGSPHLYVGQRNRGVHSVFKGLLQDVRLVRGADGQRVQCPNLDTSCPTCGQFIAMQKTMENLNKIVHLLSDKLEAAETRIAELETCECRKPCMQLDEQTNNTVMRVDGSVWQHECETCTCLRGQVECSPVRCPQIDCKYPVRKAGECCDSCQKPCRTKGDIVFEHGDTINLEPCLTCICLNGVVKCDKIDEETQCPVLECDVSEQFSVPDQCCKFCPGVDYCARGGRDTCHPNATCINLKTTHKCACANGYAGTGLQCDDVDECANIGGPNGHHCDANTTVCVNTPGSYSCQCKPGYGRLTAYECADVDECTAGATMSDVGGGGSPCHLHATCTNSPGGYACRCQDGYEGDGYTCRPVCQQKCLNGGVCARPNVCSCPNAFEGPACELDVDECATGAHGCLGPSSRCVNMAGWYYCACSPGYQNVIMYPAEPAAAIAASDLDVFTPTWSSVRSTTCQDVDECATNNHTCHPLATCVNTIGSYECKCPASHVGGNGSAGCKSSCFHRDGNNVVTEVDDGAWLVPKECTNCTCTGGRLNCTRIECDCEDSGHAQSACCAHCNAQASCAHQELANVTFHSGQQWIYQCQTCECLMGQVDCWPMQCPPILPTGAGGCVDSAFADYNKPVADCCAPRCNSKAALVASSAASNRAAVTAVTVADPCSQLQLNEHHDGGTNADDNSDNSNNSNNNNNNSNNNDNNNNTLQPAAAAGKPCFYDGRYYQSGARWDDPVDMCTSCDCKDGVLCCSYNVRYCNNSAVAGATSHPAIEDVVHDLSARQPRDVSNQNATGVQSAGENVRRADFERSVRRRRQATMVNVDDNWWWRKTRRRKRRRTPQNTGSGGGRHRTSSVISENHVNGNDNINIDDHGVNSKTKDNNNNNDIHHNRIVLKTVVVT